MTIIGDNGEELLRIYGDKVRDVNEYRELARAFRMIDNGDSPIKDQFEEKLNIIEDMAKHECNKEGIFPPIALRLAFTPDSVERLLREAGHTRDDTKAKTKQILSSFCQVLGILVKIDRAEWILAFVSGGLCDKCIPLRLVRNEHFYREGETPFQVPGWKRRDYQSFKHWQGAFITPFLAREDGRIYHYKLDIEERHLPITETRSIGTFSNPLYNDISTIVPENEGEGAQGVVTKIKLHPLSFHFGAFPVCFTS